MQMANVLASLQATDQRYKRFEMQDGISALVTQRGARIMPFVDEGQALYWLNPALGNSDTFSAWLEADGWNLGGERIWIAPEVQYHVRDRNDVDGTFFVPRALDPGRYRLDVGETGLPSAMQQLTLNAHNIATGEKTFVVGLQLRLVDNPLRYLSAYDELMDEVRYNGYAQLVTLSEQTSNAVMSESWNLVSLIPGGYVRMQAAPQAEVTRYFGDPPQGALITENGCLKMQIDGETRWKTGYKSVHVSGRIAYMNHYDENNCYLLVRYFNNNPSSKYVEEAPGHAGKHGESVHIYSSGDLAQKYGTMECHGQTIGGDTRRSRSEDSFLMWIYIGKREKMLRIASHLLHINAT